VVLMADDLAALPYAVKLSQKARAVVIQNVTLAVGVMVVLVAWVFLASTRRSARCACRSRCRATKAARWCDPERPPAARGAEETMNTRFAWCSRAS